MKSPESYLRDTIKSLEISSVLDVGTGHPGIFDYWFWQSKSLYRKVCLDIKLIRRDIAGWQKIIADARCLPFRDGSFDLVQSTEMIEHVSMEDHRTVLRELKRVASKTVFLSSSGEDHHKGPEQEALEEINPWAKYRGIISRELLIQEGFRILFYRFDAKQKHVKAVYYKK